MLEDMLEKDDLYIEKQKDSYTFVNNYIIRFNTPKREA